MFKVRTSHFFKKLVSNSRFTSISLLTLLGVLPAVNANTLVNRLNSMQPRQFDCAQEKSGSHICVSTSAAKFQYPKKIALVIPTQVQNPSSALLYFHGWRGVCESADLGILPFLKTFRLAEQFSQASEGDAVLIVPLSSGRNETHNAALAPKFRSFSSWIRQLLGTQSLKWDIAGHSGAYAPIHTVLGGLTSQELQSVRSIGLLDATYSSRTPEVIVSAVKKKPSLKIFSAYISGSRTASVSLSLKSDSRIKNKMIVTSASGGHCQSPKVDLLRYLNY